MELVDREADLLVRDTKSKALEGKLIRTGTLHEVHSTVRNVFTVTL